MFNNSQPERSQYITQPVKLHGKRWQVNFVQFSLICTTIQLRVLGLSRSETAGLTPETLKAEKLQNIKKLKFQSP